MNKVFKASAGTGKTYSLSLEYIGALLRGDKFEEILVMTFTRKATAEIRDRILRFLDTITTGWFSEDIDKQDEAKNLLKYIEENLDIEIDDNKIKNLRSIYVDIISNKEKIEIYTIDGFINKLFKKIVTPPRQILSYDMEEGEEIFEKVLEKIVNTEEYFVMFEEYFKDEKKRDIEEYLDLIKTLIYSRWKHYLVGQHKDRKPMANEDLFFKVEELIFSIRDFIEKKEKNPSKVFKANIKEYVALDNAEEKKLWLDENMAKLVGDTIWNGNQVKGAANSSYKDAFLDNMEDIWQVIARDIYNNKIIPFEKLYFSIANVVYEVYDRIRYTEQVFSFNDLSYYTLVRLLEGKYVKDKKLTDKFYKVYGNKFTTVFLDEFQDTSILQWKILHALVNSANYSIIVGDEKQSIYGWRGGEKDLFARLPDIIGAEEKVLPTCFRSHEIIIDFVNEYFTKLQGWEYKPVNSVKKGGYVEINIDKNTEESPRILAEKVKEEKDYGGVGVLARNNNQLLAIAREFEAENIPYVLESNQMITEHEACKPLYNLSKFLAYRDYFALIKFLRSKVVAINGVKFSELLQNMKELRNYFENQEFESFDDETMLILDSIKSIMQINNYKNQIKKIIEVFPFLDLYTSESEGKNLYYFFTLMNKFDSLVEFLLWVDEKDGSEALKRVGTEDNDAVKLMTIHKSKGLEFTTQYFYWVVNGRTMPPRGVEFFLNLSYDFEEVEDYFVCDVKYRKILSHLGLEYYELAEKKSYDEEINNLYVALTRPEKNLYCYYLDNAPRTPKFADEKKGEISPIDKALIDYIPYETLRDAVDIGVTSGQYIEPKIRVKEEKETNYNLDGLFDFKDFVKKQNVISFATEYKRKEGLALHYFFEFIYYGRDEELVFAKNQTLLKYSNMIGSDIHGIIARAEKFVAEHLKEVADEYALFNPRWSVYNEFELLDEDKIKRLDRLMVDRDKKEAYIIDYKDSKDPEGKSYYLKQIDEYIDILSKQLPDYKVFGKLLEID